MCVRATLCASSWLLRATRCVSCWRLPAVLNLGTNGETCYVSAQVNRPHSTHREQFYLQVCLARMSDAMGLGQERAHIRKNRRRPWIPTQRTGTVVTGVKPTPAPWAWARLTTLGVPIKKIFFTVPIACGRSRPAACSGRAGRRAGPRQRARGEEEDEEESCKTRTVSLDKQSFIRPCSQRQKW